MTTITIEGKNYQIIEGTQSDGRCFSASVYYSLYGKPAENDDLNYWIEYSIINPILDTEKTDCSYFLKWVMIWTGIHRTNIQNDI